MIVEVEKTQKTMCLIVFVFFLFLKTVLNVLIIKNAKLHKNNKKTTPKHWFGEKNHFFVFFND